MRYERLLNSVATTLNGAINDSVTSITVSDGSVFPSEGDYRLIIGSEIVLVTARSANVLTVTRGVEASTAASHSNGDDIESLLTSQALQQYIRDFINPTAFYAPPNRLLDSSGNVLTKASFTEINFASSTGIDDADGGITIQMEQAASPYAIGYYKTAPATPYTLTAHVMNGIGENSASANAVVLGFREAATGKLSFISHHPRHSVYCQYLDSPTVSGAANSAQEDVGARYDIWFRVENDGTNLSYQFSADGVNFRELHSELVTFHFTAAADQIWWGGDNQGLDDQMIHLKSWIEE